MAAPLLLPDSNVYILGTRRRYDPFKVLAAHALDWDIATCGMVRLEVLRGLTEPGALRHFESTFDDMIQLPVTEQTWQRTAQLARSLDRQGIVLPSPDLLIAAIALENSATVLTFDRHFSQVPGLQVIDLLD